MAQVKSCPRPRFVDSRPSTMKSRDEIGEQRRGSRRRVSSETEADNVACWRDPRVANDPMLCFMNEGGRGGGGN